MKKKREEDIDAYIEREKRDGKAWQEREMRMAQEAAQTEGGMKDLTAKMAAEAFTGQDAAEILGDPAFDPPSPGILDQPLLVIFQEAKMVEVSDRYHYALPDGTELAVGDQVNQGSTRKLLRMSTSLDSMMKSVVEVTQDGAKVFAMERKGTFGKNTMVITDAAGAEVGEVKQTKKGPRRASFALRSGGQDLATMETGRLGEGRGFDILDPEGELVAIVRRLHQGVFKSVSTSMLSSPDNYALRLARQLTDPLRTLVIATPMSVDSAINQRNDGVGLEDVKGILRKFT